MKPILAITMGDPAGIGPEIVVKALGSPRLRSACRPVVVGRRPVLEAAARRLRAKVAFDPVGVAAAGRRAGALPARRDRARARPAPAARAAERRRGARRARGGQRGDLPRPRRPRRRDRHRADQQGGDPRRRLPVPGAHRDCSPPSPARSRYAMMLVGGPLRVSLATIHVPLARVPALITAAARARDHPADLGGRARPGPARSRASRSAASTRTPARRGSWAARSAG